MRRVYPVGGAILFIYSLIFVLQVDFNSPSFPNLNIHENLSGLTHDEEDWSITVGSYDISVSDLAISANFSKISIAIGIPIAGSASYSSFLDSPLWNHFIPFFVNYTEIPSRKYSHTIILGYDAGDPLFDVKGVPAQVRKKFYQTMAECFIKNHQSFDVKDLPVVKMLRVTGTHSPTQAVVAVMNYAYKEGYEYFYQMNDDTLFLSYGWEDLLIGNLKTSRLFPNFGVTGPMDLNNWEVITHAFVHRTHLDIFGTFFPTSFQNWFSDDWITQVYGKRFVPRFADVSVGHVASITRYIPDMKAKNILQQEINEGRVKIMNWLATNKDTETAKLWNITKNAPPGIPTHVALKGN